MLEFIGAIFIILFGSLGHFIFEWSGHKRWAGTFFAVNESTWEHIKLAIYPLFIWMVVEICFRGFSPWLICVQAISMITTILLIPGLFYGYTAITKKNWLISDILCFVLAAAGGMWVFSSIIEPGVNCGIVWAILSALVLAAILFAYLRFSYHPPFNFLFKDPVSGGYGPHGHGCHPHFHNV